MQCNHEAEPAAARAPCAGLSGASLDVTRWRTAGENECAPRLRRRYYIARRFVARLPDVSIAAGWRAISANLTARRRASRRLLTFGFVATSYNFLLSPRPTSRRVVTRRGGYLRSGSSAILHMRHVIYLLAVTSVDCAARARASSTRCGRTHLRRRRLLVVVVVGRTIYDGGGYSSSSSAAEERPPPRSELNGALRLAAVVRVVVVLRGARARDRRAADELVVRPRRRERPRRRLALRVARRGNVLWCNVMEWNGTTNHSARGSAR